MRKSSIEAGSITRIILRRWKLVVFAILQVLKSATQRSKNRGASSQVEARVCNKRGIHGDERRPCSRYHRRPHGPMRTELQRRRRRGEKNQDEHREETRRSRIVARRSMDSQLMFVTAVPPSPPKGCNARKKVYNMS